MSARLSELRALLAKATPRPWEPNTEIRGWAQVLSASGRICGEVYHASDAALIAAAVNALPALLDVAEAAKFLADEDPCNCADHAALRRALAKLSDVMVPNVHGDEK